MKKRKSSPPAPSRGKVRFEEVEIGRIKPYANNPRVNAGAVPAVKASIERFGFKRPIVVDEDFVVLAGHTRLLALRELGRAECLVAVVTGLSEDQKRFYRIADNRAGELTLFDFDKVAEERTAMPDVDFTPFGFDPVKIAPPAPAPTDLSALPDGAVVCPRCGKIVED